MPSSHDIMAQIQYETERLNQLQAELEKTQQNGQQKIQDAQAQAQKDLEDVQRKIEQQTGVIATLTQKQMDAQQQEMKDMQNI